jgi:transposase
MGRDLAAGINKINMVASYPVSLRWRVVYLLFLEGLSVPTVSRILHVGETFVKKIRDIYNRNHSVDYNPRPGKKLDGKSRINLSKPIVYNLL